MKNKDFFKQGDFYLMICSLVLVILALGFYAGNCASEFNGGAVSSNVVTGHIIAIIFLVLGGLASVMQFFLPNKPIVKEVAKYGRFFLYIAFLALLYSFFMAILDEYSLIGTILYPIVSGTVGDPVDKVLLVSYLTQLICTYAAIVCALTSALMQKSKQYNTEKFDKSKYSQTRV